MSITVIIHEKYGHIIVVFPNNRRFMLTKGGVVYEWSGDIETGSWSEVKKEVIKDA